MLPQPDQEKHSSPHSFFSLSRSNTNSNNNSSSNNNNNSNRNSSALSAWFRHRHHHELEPSQPQPQPASQSPLLLWSSREVTTTSATHTHTHTPSTSRSNYNKLPSYHSIGATVTATATTATTLTATATATTTNKSITRRRRRQQQQQQQRLLFSPLEMMLSKSSSLTTAENSSSGSSSSRRHDEEEEEEEEDAPTPTTTITSTTTPWQAFLHLLKGYVGPGCLSLPWALSQLGLINGMVACFAMAYWSSYNCWTVVQIKRYVQRYEQQEAEHDQEADDHEDTEEEDASSSSPQQQQRHCQRSRQITYADVAEQMYGSPLAHRITTMLICLQQLAICTVFFSFMGVNFQAVLRAVCHVDWTLCTVLTVVLPAVLLLSSVPNLKALAPVTAVGTALLLVGLGLLGVVMVLVVLQGGGGGADGDDLDNGNSSSSSSSSNNNNSASSHDSNSSIHWSKVPLALCAILYSYEGICLILPVESSLQHSRRYFFSVFAAAMTTAATIFALVAGSSALVFGPVTNGSITAFLLTHYAHDPVLLHWILAANAAVTLSVLVTYPLQMFPCIEMVENWLWVRQQHEQEQSTPPTNPRQRRRRRRRLVRTGVPYHATQPHGEDGSDDPVDGYCPNHWNGSTSNGVGDAATACSTRSGWSERTTTTDCGTENNKEEEEGEDHWDGSDGDGIFRANVQDDDGAQIHSDATGATPVSHNTLLVRLVLVLTTYLVAVLVPNVQTLISLAGAVAGSSTALLLPPLLDIAWVQKTTVVHEHNHDHRDGHDMLFGRYNHGRTMRLWRNYALVLGGLLFLIIGTYASLVDIVRVYTGKV